MTTQDPQQMVTVPRSEIQYVCDLLAERVAGSPARSAGHNARVRLESLLSASPPAPEDMRERVARELHRRFYVVVTGHDDCLDWDAMPQSMRDAYLAGADAILAALSPVAVAGREDEPASDPCRLPAIPAGMVVGECPYNHPIGTRCPACSKWPYPKGGAADYMAKHTAQPLATTGDEALLPVEPGALASSIAYLDRHADDPLDDIENWQEYGESVLLVLHELKRLRASGQDEALREALRPMDTAPKDGRYILALVGSPSERYRHLTGRSFAIRHEGRTPSDYDLGWAVFPGFGGASDDWFSGWLPLPTALATPADEARLTSGGATSARGQASPGSPRG